MWLAREPLSYEIVRITRQQIESAIASGVAFTLRMANGKEYPVPHRDYISLPPKGAYAIRRRKGFGLELRG